MRTGNTFVASFAFTTLRGALAMGAILALGVSALAGATEGVTRVAFVSQPESTPTHDLSVGLSAGPLDDKNGNDVIETPTGTLYYNKSNGRGMVAGVNADGFPSFRVDYDFGPGWDKVVSVGDSLFFYSSDGAAVVGHIDAAEQFIRTKSYPAGTFKSFNKALASLDSGSKLR
jgi:hypothetical protein